MFWAGLGCGDGVLLLEVLAVPAPLGEVGRVVFALFPDPDRGCL